MQVQYLLLLKKCHISEIVKHMSYIHSSISPNNCLYFQIGLHMAFSYISLKSFNGISSLSL